MIRGAFDTDKLAFTELLGVPNAIRGGGFLRLGAPQVVAPVCYLKLLHSRVFISSMNRDSKKKFRPAHAPLN